MRRCRAAGDSPSCGVPGEEAAALRAGELRALEDDEDDEEDDDEQDEEEDDEEEDDDDDELSLSLLLSLLLLLLLLLLDEALDRALEEDAGELTAAGDERGGLCATSAGSARDAGDCCSCSFKTPTLAFEGTASSSFHCASPSSKSIRAMIIETAENAASLYVEMKQHHL